MKKSKNHNSITPTWVKISGLFFYPFYAWLGLLIFTGLFFPKSHFSEILYSPIRSVFFESSDNWEGCWTGLVSNSTTCYETSYEELSYTEKIDLELENDVYSIEGEDIYQVTRKTDCIKEHKNLTPYSMDLGISMDAKGHYFQWKEKKGYLNSSGIAKIEFSHKNDSIYLKDDFIVKIDIDADTLKFRSTMKVYYFDELEYILHSEGKFTKKMKPCEDGISFLPD